MQKRKVTPVLVYNRHYAVFGFFHAGNGLPHRNIFGNGFYIVLHKVLYLWNKVGQIFRAWYIKLFKYIGSLGI